jgi:hypothetical protein
MMLFDSFLSPIRQHTSISFRSFPPLPSASDVSYLAFVHSDASTPPYALLTVVRQMNFFFLFFAFFK